jgi:hypothetical protein
MAPHKGDVVLDAPFAQRRPRTILDETDELGKSVDKVRYSAFFWHRISPVSMSPHKDESVQQSARVMIAIPHESNLQPQRFAFFVQ